MNLRYNKIHQAILVALFVSASADVSAAWFSNAPDSQFLNKQQYAYDAEGRLDRVATLDGTESRFAYDKAGRLSQLSIKPPSKLSNWYSPKSYVARFSYDPNGNMTEVADGAGKTQYAYDKQNRPETVTAADGRTLRYASKPLT